jgi:hypothetical protein
MAAMSLLLHEPTAPAIQVVYWQDVFVVSDNGRGLPEHYKGLRDLVLERVKRYPSGVGMLSIIPEEAVPPSDKARAAMNEAIAQVSGSLRCICWLVEGTGFQGAMVRAVLTGLRIFGKKDYPSNVCATMPSAMRWILNELDGGKQRFAHVDAAIAQIQHQRMEGTFVRSY